MQLKVIMREMFFLIIVYMYVCVFNMNKMKNLQKLLDNHNMILYN